MAKVARKSELDARIEELEKKLKAEAAKTKKAEAKQSLSELDNISADNLKHAEELTSDYGGVYYKVPASVYNSLLALHGLKR